MATVKFDAVATIRYTQGGEEKKRYHKMGVVFESDKGLNLKLESIPVGFDGWISFYEPKPKEQAQKPARGNTSHDDSGDIPFLPIGRGIAGHAI